VNAADPADLRATVLDAAATLHPRNGIGPAPAKARLPSSAWTPGPAGPGQPGRAGDRRRDPRHHPGRRHLHRRPDHLPDRPHPDTTGSEPAPDPALTALGLLDNGAVIGHGTRLWHHAQVAAGARVGQDCILGKGAYVGTGSLIGDRVKIGNHADIFGRSSPTTR